ncbi:MAG: 50S ribosomal protein L1 [bacterium]|nr:50S ribosomal protein L1 [bacterium]
MGKRLNELNKLVEKSKAYPIAEAVELVKKTSGVKFDANVELHARLGIDPKKGDQQVRAGITFPKAAGKKRIIAAFVGSNDEKAAKAAGADIVGGEEMIKKIIQTKKTDFDVALATPEMMKALAPAARVLGPRGLMPSPKNNTITPHIADAIAEFKKGKTEFKSDGGGNVHLVLGKVSNSNEDITENLNAAINAIKKAKPSSSKGSYILNMSISSGMGPGIKIQTS